MKSGKHLSNSGNEPGITGTLPEKSGKVVFDREVTGRTTVRVGSDLPSAERQAVPVLAEDFARNATTLLAEGTW